MSTDFKSIPLIDITPLVEKWDDSNMMEDKGVAEVVRQLDKACREAGFFYVKGHGIPDSLVKEVRNVAHKFFSLPYEQKLKIKMSATTGYRGYQRVGENITKGIPDMHEAIDVIFTHIKYHEPITLHSHKVYTTYEGVDVILHSMGIWRNVICSCYVHGEMFRCSLANFYKIQIKCYRELKRGMYGALGDPLEGCNEWPIDPPTFKQLMKEYIRLCTELSRKIMRGIALALGASMDELEGKRAGDPFWVLRIIGYPGVSCTNGQDMPNNDVGCGAHTDYGLLTLVNQDDDKTALQVRNLSGEWISAVPIPGTFVCNIGDMLKILSNGLYESTLHRVINSSSKYRVCVAYFYEPNFDAAIEPLDICMQRSDGTKKFEPAVYGEHLVSKVLTNFVM